MPATTRTAPTRRARRSGFGAIRKLPSGRHQARYTGPDGATYRGPVLFDTRRAAENWLAGVRTDIARGDWQAPGAAGDGPRTLSDYAHNWLDGRLDLAPRTRALYTGLLARWIDADVPHPAGAGGRPGAPIRLGDHQVDKLTPTLVRDWTGAVAHATRDAARRREAGARNGSRQGHPALRLGPRHRPAGAGHRPAVTGPDRANGRPRAARTPASTGRPTPTPAAPRPRTPTGCCTVLTVATKEGLLPANPCQQPRAGTVRPAERKEITP